MENPDVEKRAAQAILNSGVRYTLGDGKITIRPLVFGTTLTICERVCEAGLTLEEINSGKNNIPPFVVKYGKLMLECVAIAEFNKKEDFEGGKINDRIRWYSDNLTAYQIYELFEFVLKLSGIESFCNTIGLIWMIKQMNLSPKVKGS